MEPILALGREQFGNYVVESAIGAGGMGAVYRAVHPEIGKVVAIKLLRPELARDDIAVARFFDEARAANAIRNEGIVDIFDLGRRSDGTVYLVMEYLAGEDLGRLLDREGRLPPARAIPLIIQVCDSVGAAHRRGIVHRDLKPQNLFLVHRAIEERVKILDFGIAKLQHDTSRRPTTNTGVVLGTIQYMSPEQATAQPVDARADIYSIGCILYEMLTGVPPFEAQSVFEAIAAKATLRPIPPSHRVPTLQLPRALDEVLMRALARDPGDRYADTEEMSAALRACQDALPSNISPLIPRLSIPSPPANPVLPEAQTPQPSPPVPTPQVPQISGDLRALAEKEQSTEAQLLRATTHPLIDSEMERRVIIGVIPILIVLFLAGVLFYYLPPQMTLMDRAVLRTWLPIYGLDILSLGVLLGLMVKTQQNSNLRWLVNRLMTLNAVATITFSLHLKGSVTSYDILYYPLVVIVDRIRENRSLARLTLVTCLLAYLFLVLLGHFRMISYAPLYPGHISPAIIADRGLIVLVFFVVSGCTSVSYILIDLLATNVQKREQELRELGRGLAGRIEEQLQILRRSERLRRYVSPQLAEAILQGEATGVAAHERRRLTLVRVDCPAIARAAEKVDPEELALLLNEFFGMVADLATESGGTVDRFFGAEISVLFGAPRSAGAVEDAQRAVRFALGAIPKVRELARRCEVAGVEEAPLGRAAVHTGFATVGSFGSPARLAYTAVGPMVEASSEILLTASLETVLASHATWVLLKEEVESEVQEEKLLPGAHHEVKLYRILSLHG